ncbi:MAG TPA: tripartite tricarboxylate transporter substrate binding protein [Burkholderiaceae bacterium]|nr:tripartite tricarboxylate transporter substrate binding protein [Burkholderiaceae bacterium]
MSVRSGSSHPHTVTVSTPLARHRFLGQLGGAGLLLAAPGAWLVSPGVHAQTYPARPIKITIAFPPGGGTDVLTRVLGEALGKVLGQSIVVENRPGAGGMIGLEVAAKNAADGYNLFLCALTNQSIASHLYPNTRTDIERNFEPVSLVASGPHVLIVNPQVPARTMPEFIAWLKANHGKVNYASQGNGTLSHLESVLFAQKVGVEVTHIPYKGSALALPDVMAGTCSFMFDSVSASLNLIKSGKVRAIAVAASQRVASLPDVPTVVESGVRGYDVENWFGLYAPKGTPPAIVARLDQAVHAVLQQPEIQASLLQKGYVINYGSPARLATVTQSDRNLWGSVVKTANVTI